MKALFFAISLLVLISCGPRDDESLLGSGGQNNQGFDLKAGQVLSVSVEDGDEGKKIDSCQDKPDTNWNSVRLGDELSSIYSKIDQLSLVVGRTDFNCVPVSEKEPIVIEIRENNKWVKKDVYYYPVKIEMHNTMDYLAKQSLLKEHAAGMKMTPEELKTFITSGNQPKQITVTYFKKSTEPPKTEEPFVFEYGRIETVEEPGLKLTSCLLDKDPWKSIRLPVQFEAALESVEQVKAIVGNKAENCLAVSDGETIELEVQKEEGSSSYEKTKNFFLVNKLELINKQYLLSDKLKEKFSQLATDMQVLEEDLRKYLESEEVEDVVTISYLESSEEVVAESKSLLKQLSLPANKGETLGSCDKPWPGIRVKKQWEDKIQVAIEQKTLGVIVDQRDSNCVDVGGQKPLELYVDGNWVLDDTKKVEVYLSEARTKKSVLEDRVLLRLIGNLSGGLSVEEVSEIIKSYNDDNINLVYFDWVK